MKTWCNKCGHNHEENTTAINCNINNIKEVKIDHRLNYIVAIKARLGSIPKSKLDEIRKISDAAYKLLTEDIKFLLGE